MALSTQRASASFLLNESASLWKYDVFLSFRGVDTCRGFVSHLHHELSKRQGITTFMDDRELEGGTSIHLEFPSAIKESHIAIVVLSRNYASSKWCLDELTTILQCMEARNSVLPVFYQTDPSDVGNQRGCFAEAFKKHEEKLISIEGKKKVLQWKADLKRVSKICGWTSKESKCESELIQKIVKSVRRKVQATLPLLDSSQKLVGVDFGLEQPSSLLAHYVNNVCFMGITGMGGIVHDLQQLLLTLSNQRASASFLSIESIRWDYDVFLSFRGVDTRKGFISHLYGELFKWQGIRTFLDGQEIEGGTSILLELPSAIEKSRTAIVVLSRNYASSNWCLDELTTILQCMETRKSVLPIFYETDPSGVGNQRGSFAEAFEEHERNLISTEDKKKVVQWKADLKRVSKISGKHWNDFKCDRELIEDIVKWVRRKVQPTLSVSSRNLVGIDNALEQLSLLLAHDVNDVRFIGITGRGGIGKTTLAKLVYDKIRLDFQVHWFLVDVREVFANNYTVDLAKKLLFPFLGERTAEIWDEERVSFLIEKFLRRKKVLLVLDDVDQSKQLEVLAGNPGWFGMGSRIIVTTRNRRLLVQHGIETSYEVQGLNDAKHLSSLACLPLSISIIMLEAVH
ncbi:hypothetical protein C1H46_008896 [Malus baccata]|uniref:TIR domain-containing protein n=1 Tax=Malus baccata TaxID=106549 RepID=A0A540N350_MALBA|nr:hypothetical protein C1H46_008896 [Malus baccata]